MALRAIKRPQTGDKVKLKRNLVLGQCYGGYTLLPSMKKDEILIVETAAEYDAGCILMTNRFYYSPLMLTEVK